MTAVDDFLLQLTGTVSDGPGNLLTDITSFRAAIAELAGGGGSTFRGVLLNKTADQTLANTTVVDSAFNTAIYDTDSFFAIGSPTEIVIPAGITRVQLNANLGISNSNGTGSSDCFIRLNGLATPAGIPTETKRAISGNNSVYSLTSAVINVVETDILTLGVSQNSGVSVNIRGSLTWFSLQVIE